MNTDGKGLKHYELTRSVIGIFYQVYNELGQRFLEAVYIEALSVALRTAGLSVHRELPIKVHFRGHVVGRFRADAVVNGKVLLEVKALPKLEPMHGAQILNYLRATVLEVGLLLNFGRRPQFRRLRFDNGFKPAHHHRPFTVEATVSWSHPLSSVFIRGCFTQRLRTCLISGSPAAGRSRTFCGVTAIT